MDDKLVDGETPQATLLVNEVFRSILQPEHFVDVLELWDRSVSGEHDDSESTLDALEAQVSDAIPLLEASLKSVVNEDELLNRLARLDRPGMLVSGNGVIVGVNDQGRSHFGLEAGDRIDFTNMEPSAARQLQKIIAHAHETRGKDAFAVINMDGASRGVQPADNLVACRSISVEAGNVGGYVLINAMNLVFSQSGSQAFRAAFGATDAEMRILDHLVAGRRQTEIAELDGIREDTVKKHIQSIREKASVPNTTALICLAAGFAQISADQGQFSIASANQARSVTNASGQTYTRPGRHKVISVDGLKVEYIDEGSPSGKPLLIHHSSMVGFVLPPEFIQDLCDAGYRVIMPFRPRCGISEDLPGGYSLEKVSKHLLRFLDALQVKQVVCVAGTVGFFYAAEMAALAPDRMEAIVGVAAYLPVDRAELHKSMAKFQRAVMYTQLRNRRLAKFLVLSGYKMYLQFGAYKFLAQMLRNSPSDLKVLENANSLGVLSVGLRIGGAQGVDALLDDTSVILSDWSDVMNRVKCPVHLIHGSDDSVFKPEIVERFCQSREGFDLTIVPGKGQLMIYADPSQIASMIVERFERNYV